MLLNLIKVGLNELINRYTDKGKMLFGKTRKIQELEAKIMETEMVIHDILFNEKLSKKAVDMLISILIVLDKEYTEFILNEYLDVKNFKHNVIKASIEKFLKNNK